jgi:hypothetical protein
VYRDTQVGVNVGWAVVMKFYRAWAALHNTVSTTYPRGMIQRYFQYLEDANTRPITPSTKLTIYLSSSASAPSTPPLYSPACLGPKSSYPVPKLRKRFDDVMRGVCVLYARR